MLNSEKNESRNMSTRSLENKLLLSILSMCIIAGFLILTSLAISWIALGFPSLQKPDSLSPKSVGEILRMGFAVVAGLGGVAALVIAYRRQRNNDQDNLRASLAEKREETRLFTERFTTASSQLGHDQAAVRLAGVHALAHLADDAPGASIDLQQMCVDVLCAYLRMPHDPYPEDEIDQMKKEDMDDIKERRLKYKSFREVRSTIVRIIADHLREEGPWLDLKYDFTGVVFDGGDFDKADFSRANVRFDYAEFSGRGFSFRLTKFPDSGVSFIGSKFDGRSVYFIPKVSKECDINFHGAEFSSGIVTFRPEAGGHFEFDYCKFNGSIVNIGGTLPVGSISFYNAKIEKGMVRFGYAELSGMEVDFGDSDLKGGSIVFSETKFTGSTVRIDVNISGGSLEFESTSISGGDILFAFQLDGYDYSATGPKPETLDSLVSINGMGRVVVPESWAI